MTAQESALSSPSNPNGRSVRSGRSRRFLPWDISAGYDFYRIADALRLPDQSIVVADGGTGVIRRFSSDGALVAESGREGEAPGEYSALHSLHVYRVDSLVAFDSWLSRATVMTMDLEVVRTVPFSSPHASHLETLPNGDFVVQFSFPSVLEYEGAGGVNRTPVPVLRYSDVGELADTLAVQPGHEELMIPGRGGWSSAFVLFARSSFMAGTGDGIVLANSDAMSFDVYGADGRRSLTARVPTWDLTLAPGAVQAEIDALLPPDASATRRQRIGEILDLQPQRDVGPAFDELLVDSEGNVWLATPKGRAGRLDPTSWVVFARDGAWQGSVRSPARFSVLDIGPDFVLGVRADELDVEHIELRGLVRPGSLPE